MLPKVLKELIIKYLFLTKPIDLVKDSKLVNDNFWLKYIDYHFGLKQCKPKLTVKETAEYANDMLNILMQKQLYFTTKSFNYIILNLLPGQIGQIVTHFAGQSLASYVFVCKYFDLPISSDFQFDLPVLPRMNDVDLPLGIHQIMSKEAQTILKILLQSIEIPTEYVTASGIKILPYNADKHDLIADKFMADENAYAVHLQLLQRINIVSDTILVKYVT